MNVENRFMKVLNGVDQYKWVDNHLVFYDKNDEPIARFEFDGKADG